MSKPNLVVIEGGSEPPKPWLDLPTTVPARSAFDPGNVVFYRIARHDVHKGLTAGRRQPLFDLWSVMLGEPPHVPNISARAPQTGELTCLAEAHACFKGIRRPLAEDDDGASVLAYILRPRVFYVYEPSMVCVAAKRPVPSDLVFVAYARLDEPAGDGPHPITGVLTHWQFVEADFDGQQLLPIDFQSRYHTRMW